MKIYFYEQQFADPDYLTATINRYSMTFTEAKDH